MIPEKTIIEPKEVNTLNSVSENVVEVDVSPEGLPIQEIQTNFNLDINTGAIENTAKVDKEYQKKFGRLYKTFDVRYLKGKIWESINEVKFIVHS